MSEKCLIVEVGNRVKVKKGKYLPNEFLGTYGKKAFAIPDGLQTVATNNKRAMQVFIVDPKTELAQPVGVSTCTDDKLGVKIEVATNKKYVKAMVLRVFDVVQILIFMSAGIGVAFLALHLLSTFTGNPVTI